MTPIPFDLPRRILPPTTAYAAGLVCELRPDLADGVRSAVLGDAAMTALDVLTLARVEVGDEQGANALAYLREICHYGGNEPRALRGLADVLFDSFQWCSPTANFKDLALSAMYLHFGFGPCWEHAKTPNDLRCLRRLITLHAHTVSLDPDVRAAWAKAHLDALADPVLPQSPDRLN